MRHGSRGREVNGGRRTNGAGVETEYGPWMRVPSPNRRRGQSRGGPFGVRTGRSSWENYGATEPGSQRKYVDDDATFGPKESSDGGSSGNSVVRARGGMGSISRNLRKDPYQSGSGNPDVITAMNGVLREGGNKGERYGELQKKTVSFEEVCKSRQETEKASDDQGKRESISKKGKNIYVGQWDTIKEKMIWQVVDKEAQWYTCK